MEGRWYYLDSGRHGEQGAARRTAHANEGRTRRLLLHTTHAENVHEHSDGAGRWWPVVRVGIEQTGRAVGAGHVRGAEHSRAVVQQLQAQDTTVLSAVAA